MRQSFAKGLPAYVRKAVKGLLLALLPWCVYADGRAAIPDSAYTRVCTYINPVIPADFPDITLFKHGDDFYACNSSFHFTPYAAILHSTDLVHWQVISRAVKPSWTGILNDGPAGGTWEGVITYFYDRWWLYFSNTSGGGQYFTSASSPYGPWATPQKMKTTVTTGPVGYDNSVFVDDDGTPYMLIKNAQYINRIQEIGRDGHLTGTVIDLNWVNADGRYSWAEGPVMCKRDGWYYYFVAGNVAGGQYVLRTRDLRADKSEWQELGNFFQNVTDSKVTLRSPNHISQPFQLNDGTWWCLAHSYENANGNDWSGKGRQGLLHQVVWDVNGKPWGVAPSSQPVAAPALINTSLTLWALMRSDDFSSTELGLQWHFLNRAAATRYRLGQTEGALTLVPGSGGTAHLLQKEAAHHYSVSTRVTANVLREAQQAGLYLTNGNESATVRLVITSENGTPTVALILSDKTLRQTYDGGPLWLRIDRHEHQIEAFYSTDRTLWTSLGTADVSHIDKGQPDYNSWVGTSCGLYAQSVTSTFDCFVVNDGRHPLYTPYFNNAYGVAVATPAYGTVMRNSTQSGGWLMLGGVDFGTDCTAADSILIAYSSTKQGRIEFWADDIERGGTLLATATVESGKPTVQHQMKAPLKPVIGQHDLYLRYFPEGGTLAVQYVQLTEAEASAAIDAPEMAAPKADGTAVYDLSGRRQDVSTLSGRRNGGKGLRIVRTTKNGIAHTSKIILR